MKKLFIIGNLSNQHHHRVIYLLLLLLLRFLKRCIYKQIWFIHANPLIVKSLHYCENEEKYKSYSK